MDNLDRKILMQLQQNAKQNTKEIAGKVGLSVTPTYERIRKLERKKIIKSYVAILDCSKIERNLIAFCQVTLLQHQIELIKNFRQKARALPEVMECFNVSGNFDFLLKVAVEDINQFQIFINEKLSVVEGISTIQSSFVINTVKESTVYVL